MNKNDIFILDDSRVCCGKIDVPTDEELRALNALREIKDRVRDIKKKLSEIKASDKGRNAQKIAELENEISRLKVTWREWEKERENAARERMILLGHEEA